MAVFVVFITTYMLILPAITATLSAGTLNITNVTTVTGYNAAYDGEDYTAYLEIDFTINTKDIIDNKYTAIYYLPDGVEPPAVDKNQELPDRNGHFTYYYRQDSEGKWYIEVNFDDDYINGLNGSSTTGVTASGYIRFNATISSDLWDETDGIKAEFDDQVYLIIDDSEITYPENSTGTADITVDKTASSYNSSENYIEYSVTVSTTKGSGDVVTLTDVLGTLTDLSVESINVQSVTYASSGSSGSEVTKVSGSSDVSGTKNGSSYYFAASGTDFTMTLSEMDANSTYTIVYRVYLDDIYENVSELVSNSIKATAEKDIHYEDDASITVNYSHISKTYSVNSSDGTITWTVTINAAGADIAGYTFTDSMLSKASSITVKRKDGTIAYENSEYTINKNADNTYGSITFNGVNEYYNAVTGGSNTNTYVITYTTSSSLTLGETSEVTNTASLTKDGEGGSTTAGTTLTGGSISKADSGAEEDADGDGLITINWTTTITVPASGIAKGTVIGDYLDNDESVSKWNNNNTYDYTSLGGQWFTYEQIQKIYCTVSSQYYTNNIQATTATGSTALTAYYVTDETNSENKDPAYTIYVYCINTSTGEGSWELLSTVMKDSSTYNATNSEGDAIYKFTGFQIKFLTNVTLTDTSVSYAKITLTYSSTADISSIDSAAYYRNYTFVQNGNDTIDSYAEHEEEAYVMKTNGNGNTGTTYTTLDANANGNITLTWIVKAYVPAGTTTTYYTITDTLPSGVTLSSVKVSNGTTDVTLTNTGGSLSGTLDSGTISGTVSGQEVSIKVPSESYSSLAASGGYITVTYTCTAAFDYSEYEDNKTYTIGSYANTVKVSTDTNADFGSASQTQTYYYKNTVAVKSKISKSGTWNESAGRYAYNVVINPAAEDLLDGSDELELIDTLSAYMNEDYGQYASIVPSSVKFYELVELTANGDETYSYTDAEGTTYTYSSDDSSLYTFDGVTYLMKEIDISWTYSATNYETGTNTYTITATVPDETAILMVYTYLLYALDGNGNIPKTDMGITINVTNNASLTGTSESTSHPTGQLDYYDHGNEAGMLGLTIYKVDSTNYSVLLPDATFEIYKYDSAKQEFVSTGITISTDSTGTVTLAQSDLKADDGTDYFSYNTAYYLVETDAPDGYYLNSTTLCYFYWGNDDTTVYPECCPDGFINTNGVYNNNDVYNLTSMTKSAYIENVAKTYVEVEKVWKDQDGNTITDGLPDSVTVDLYSYTTASETTTEAEKKDVITKGTGTLVKSDIVLNSANGWSMKVTSDNNGDPLPSYDSTNDLYYHYYFVETKVGDTAIADALKTGYYELTYTTSDGTDNAVTASSTNGGKVTITNKVERTYTIVNVDKSWAYKDASNTKTVPESSKEAVTIALLRKAFNAAADAYELVDMVTLDGTVDGIELEAWKVSWSNLLYSYTEPDGDTITYSYYIAEVVYSDDIDVSYDGISTSDYITVMIDTTASETSTKATAYLINITDAAAGGDVDITNKIDTPENKAITVKKVWQDYSGNAVTLSEDTSVTLQLYVSNGSASGIAGGTFDDSGYVSGDTSGYVVTLKYNSSDGTYTLTVPFTDPTPDVELTTASQTSTSTTFTDAAGNTITLTLNSDGSVTWSGMDGAYDYYVVETAAMDGGTDVMDSSSADKYTTWYSVDDGSTTSTEASDYVGAADVTASSGDKSVLSVINRKNSGDTELTVNKAFAGGTTETEYVYFQLYQEKTTIETSASGEVLSTSTETTLYTDGATLGDDSSYYYIVAKADGWTLTISDLPNGSTTQDASSGDITTISYSYYLVETGAGDSISDATNLSSKYSASYTDGSGNTITGTSLTVGSDTVTAYLVNGTEMNIRNIDVNAKLLVEKVWQDGDGNTITNTPSDASVDVTVYQVAEWIQYSGSERYTVEVYYNDFSEDNLVVSTTISSGATFKIESVTFSGWSGGANVYVYDETNSSWTYSQYIYSIKEGFSFKGITQSIRIEFFGGWSASTDKVTWSTEGDETGETVRTISEYKTNESVTLNADNDWSYIWTDLPLTDDTGKITYTYYVIETSAAYDGKSLAASLSDGIVLYSYYSDSNGNSTVSTVTSTTGSNSPINKITKVLAVGAVEGLNTVTITNRVEEEDNSLSITAEKNWTKNGSSLEMSDVTITVKLLQVLTAADKDPLYNKSLDTEIDYTKEITFNGTSTGEASWTDLPATLTVDGVEYTCTYYIVEVSAENGSGTSILDKYSVSYTIDASDASKYEYTYTDTNSGNTETVTYYAVSNGETITITNTATDSIVLPVTGGHGIRNLILIAGSTLMLFAIAVALARQRRMRRWSS